MPAIVTLVALRLAIGWHFYKEGVSHHTDPHWSSEGFLKQARGPLGPLYHGLVSDFHGWDRLMLAPLADDKSEEAGKLPKGETGEKADKPAADKPAADKADEADKALIIATSNTTPVSEKSPDEKSEQSAGGEKSAGETSAKDAKAEGANGKPASDKSTGDKPASDKSAEKPASDKSAGEKSAEKPASEKPAATKPANDKEASPKKAAADKPKPPLAADAWLKQVKQDWSADAEAAAAFYKFDEAQKQKATKLVDADYDRMWEVASDYDGDIVLYRRLVGRADHLATVPGVDVIPFEKARAAAVQKNPLGETGISGTASPLSSAPPVWLAAAQDVDKLFHDQLAAIAIPEQRQAGALPGANSKLHKLDTALAWTLMIVGGLLIVGLFTRLAALVGALFLLSIICAQPPWLADSLQTFTYNQTVEMLALLVLATVGAGRWGGLDFFVSRCCGGCCSAKSGTGTSK